MVKKKKPGRPPDKGNRNVDVIRDDEINENGKNNNKNKNNDKNKNKTKNKDKNKPQGGSRSNNRNVGVINDDKINENENGREARYILLRQTAQQILRKTQEQTPFTDGSIFRSTFWSRFEFAILTRNAGNAGSGNGSERGGGSRSGSNNRNVGCRCRCR